MITIKSLVYFNLICFLFLLTPVQGVSQTLKIGEQIWAEKNLTVNVFKNGDTIRYAPSKEEWIEAGNNKQPAWCYYDNNPKNENRFGKLYNFYAVNDSRGLAPKGWSIPTIYDFNELVNFYGGSEVSLKASDTNYHYQMLSDLKEKFKHTTNDSIFFQEHNFERYTNKKIRTIIDADSSMIFYQSDVITNASIAEFEQAKVGDVIGPMKIGKHLGIAKITDFKTVDYATVRHILLSNTSDNKTRTQDKADSIIEVIKAQDNFDEMVRLFSEDPGSIERGGVYKDFTRDIMVPEFNDFSFDNPVSSLGTVSTAFGIHIIEVLNQYKKERPEVIFIKKELRAGSSAATRMKDKKEWSLYPIHGVTKDSFKAIPAGYRLSDGRFIEKNQQTLFWANTIIEENLFAFIGLISGIDQVIINTYDQPGSGFSVRCIRANN